MAYMLTDKLRPSMKVYGPYFNHLGRKHIILYDGKTRKTMSYPKWLMEQHLNRFLSEDETIDHIDRDFTNDNLSNLQILPFSEHIQLDIKRRKEVEATCVWSNCNKKFILTRDQNRSKAGPFCSKSCAGKYGASVQNGGQKLSIHKIEFEYYQIDKSQSSPMAEAIVSKTIK